MVRRLGGTVEDGIGQGQIGSRCLMRWLKVSLNEFYVVMCTGLAFGLVLGSWDKDGMVYDSA